MLVGFPFPGAHRGSSGAPAAELLAAAASPPGGRDLLLDASPNLAEPEGYSSRFARMLEEESRRLEERDAALGAEPRPEPREAARRGPSPSEEPGREQAPREQASEQGARRAKTPREETEGGESPTEDARRTGRAESGAGERARRLRAEAGGDGASQEASEAAGQSGKEAGVTGAGEQGRPGAGRIGAKGSGRHGAVDLAAVLAAAAGHAVSPGTGEGRAAGREEARRALGVHANPRELGAEKEGVSPRGGSDRPVAGRGGARLVVLDLREGGGGSGEAVPGRSETAGRELSGIEEARKNPAAGEGDFLALLKSEGGERSLAGAGQSGEAQKGSPSLRSFQERLVPEVVRHAGIVLKEGGSGEIRLLLKPESLGAIRIRLSLGESSLEGRIVVENNTVKDLMEASLEHLKQALREGGFHSASLEVAVNSRQNGHQAEGSAPLPRVEGPGPRELEAAVPPLLEAIALEPSRINLFV